MDTFQILFSVFLILLKCKELTTQNVIFYNTTKTWKDAANVCASTGGVLESNITLLRDLDEFKIANKDVWIGKFKTVTNWTYIRGCYLIHGQIQHFKLELSYTAEMQCQMLCEKYKLYSIKEADCYCIANISSFVRNTNCSCDGCYKVWEHQLPNFGSANGKDECIATIKCDSGEFHRGYEECSKSYFVTCDEVSNLNPLRCLSVNRENEQGPDYVECTNLLPFFCKTGGNIHEEDDLLNADGHGHSKAGLIIGIVVSITVVAFITVVILVFIFFRIHSTKHLPDSTGGSAGCTANDNTAMSNYEQLDNTAEDKNIKAYDRLHVAHIPGQFNVQFQTITSREEDELSNTKEIHAFDYTTTSEYVQLDTSDKAKSTNVYDQLHAVHAVVTGQVIGHSTTIIAREEQQNYESTENTNNIDNHTASSEYEQLDNAKQANSTHVYDQLDVAHEVNKDPTNNHLYTNI